MPISWGLAVVTAPLAPTVVFWSSIMLTPRSGGTHPWLLPAVAVLWLGVGLALAVLPRRGIRSVGIGMATGTIPCVLWPTMVALT